MNTRSYVACLYVSAVALVPSLLSAQTVPALAITSPASGTVVAPGQTIGVQVTVNPVGSFVGVVLAGENLGIAGPVAKAPYSFSLVVPSDVIGPLQLTAIGITSPNNGIQSAPVFIDSEPSVVASSLRTNVTSVQFQRGGQQMPLIVTAMLADGTALNVTKSTAVSYKSSAATVATVNGFGVVTAAGPGSGTISIGYMGLNIAVSVSVLASIRGDLNGDGRVDQDDLNIILAALDTPANGPNDARDLNHDGVIDARDAEILISLCGPPGCTWKNPDKDRDHDHDRDRKHDHDHDRD